MTHSEKKKQSPSLLDLHRDEEAEEEGSLGAIRQITMYGYKQRKTPRRNNYRTADLENIVGADALREFQPRGPELPARCGRGSTLPEVRSGNVFFPSTANQKVPIFFFRYKAKCQQLEAQLSEAINTISQQHIADVTTVLKMIQYLNCSPQRKDHA